MTHTVGTHQLTATSYSWKRPRSGLEWRQTGTTISPTQYSGKVTVAGQTSLGDTAYWLEPGNGYWTSTDRPRLIWADRSAFARWQVDVAAYLDAEADRRATQQEQRRAEQVWLDRHNAEFEQHLEQHLHEAFVVDYGSDAEDLWPGHRASINTNRLRQVVAAPIHRRGWEHVAGHMLTDVTAGPIPDAIVQYRYPPIEEGTGQ